MAKSEKKKEQKEATNLNNEVANKEQTDPQTRKKRKDSKLFKGVWGITTVLLLRLLVGGVFIFSGFAKAVDPWGSVYKFGEYLTSFGITGFEWGLMFMAISVATIEFVLGVCCLLGIYRRFTPIVMTLMMAVMLLLTLYIAITDNVSDCGCFGDAIILSNWATFFKNVLLMAGILYLLMFNRRVKNVYGYAVQWIVIFFTGTYILVIAFVGYYVQPLVDFRPFPVGSTLGQYVKSDEWQDDGENYVFIYEKDGVKQEFAIDSLPDESWTFVDRKEKPGMKQADADKDLRYLALLDKDGNPVEDVIRNEGEQLLFLFPDLEAVGVSYTYLINEIYDYAQSHGMSVIGVTSASDEETEEWNDLSMASYELYHADDSVIKMIARGNPSVVYMQDGKIVWKRTLQSISMALITAGADMADVASDFNSQQWLWGLFGTYITAMLLLLIVNRTHLLFKFRKKSSVKNENKD